jgi:transposase
MTSSIINHFIGLDLGDKSHHFCVLGKDIDAKPLATGSFPNTPEALKQFAAQWPNSKIFLEVGSHSPWISRLLQGADMQVIIANARKLKLISKNKRKSDANDAVALAKLGRSDTTLLHPISHVTEEVQRDRIHITVRRGLVVVRTKLVNTVRGLLKSFGCRLACCSSACVAKRTRELLSSEERADLLIPLEPLLLSLENISLQIAAADTALAACAKAKYPIVGKLTDIAGVGPLTALNFVLTIGDPNRFAKKTRSVGDYLGLAPARDQSGNVDKDLGISKEGNTYTRALLVQAAQYIMGPFGPPSDLRDYGLRIQRTGDEAAAKKHKGKSAPKAPKRKSIIGVARKLGVVMLAIWQKGSTYRARAAESSESSESEAAAVAVAAGGASQAA